MFIEQIIESYHDVPPPIAAEKTAIDNNLRTAFRSIHSSLKDLGFLIPPSIECPMDVNIAFEMTGKNIEAMRLNSSSKMRSENLPWPINMPESRLGIGWNIKSEQGKGLGFVFYWPTEEGEFEEIMLGYMIKGKAPAPSYHFPPETGFHYMRTRASKPEPAHPDLEVVTYASGLIAVDDFGSQLTVQQATMENWQKQEKPKLDRIVASFTQQQIAA